jgi:hypothetical protein
VWLAFRGINKLYTKKEEAARLDAPRTGGHGDLGVGSAAKFEPRFPKVGDDAPEVWNRRGICGVCQKKAVKTRKIDTVFGGLCNVVSFKSKKEPDSVLPDR